MSSPTPLSHRASINVPLTSLNAIKLSAREVAESFIAPPAFNSLARSDNAILSGPRGSGKTTLLKMLQSEALEHWNNPGAELARATVRSVGVFIGTDRTWNEQLSVASSIPEELRIQIAWAAFGTHTFKSLIEAMCYRVSGSQDIPQSTAHLRVSMSEQTQRELASGLGHLLRFKSSPSSLTVLGTMLSGRLVDLGAQRQIARRGGQVRLPSWSDLDVLTVIDAAVSQFNLLAGQPDQRWALLFDELELAPEPLVEELLGALRGHQPRLIFKLSLAPANNSLTALDGLHAPVPGQDYEHIPLTHARKTATLGFARELVRETLITNGLLPAPTVDQLLGAGDLDSADEYSADSDVPRRPRVRNNPYAKGSALWKTMESLAIKDRTFAEYLIRNQMDLEKLEALSPARRASRLRKIRNIVVVREYFRNDFGRRRSRKSYALYSGADNILSLPDGNPRVLIALARQLFGAVQGQGSKAHVTKDRQGSAIEATLQRFLPLLEAQAAVNIDGKTYALMDFLDAVGRSLAKRLVEAEFNDNVRLTFYVDDRIRPGVQDLLRIGLNAGALVYVPPKDSDGRLRGSFQGKQFRLAHLLATRYGLPIHLTQSVALSRLLPISMSVREPRRSRQQRPPSQSALFTNLHSGETEDEVHDA